VIAELVCPACRGRLVELACTDCGSAYEVIDGIPILISGDSESAAQQAAFFDDADDPEFEIERPFGLPGLYTWLLHEKYRRGTHGVSLRDRSALVVCGGSGMDAEFLARSGAEVISSDISLGAAKRALERSRRHGVPISAIVANAERLPFVDRSVDVVYVHDGLHHLENPLDGLAEMARVARHAVCVTEPSQAAVTALAVKLGISENVEEAGNRVARLTLSEVREILEGQSFRVARAQRYAMFYRHEPGPVMKGLSVPVVFLAARLAYRMANAVLAPVGNKLVVTAVRP